MAGKICHIVLMMIPLASTCLGARFVPDWESELQRNLDAMNRNLNAMTHNIQHQVQQSTRDLQARIKSQVDETIKNLPRDSEGHIINQSTMTNGGASFSSYNQNGNSVSKTTISGRTQDGKSYVRVIEERSDGKYLYHNETSRNPETNTINWTIRWKLDLTTASAKPEFITDEN